MYTQFHGEVLNGKHVDQVLREYYPDFTYNGVFFEVGAFEPILINPSYHFEQNGWDCYCFEANPDNAKLLRQHRKNVFNYAISDTNKDMTSFSVVNVNGPSGWTASFSAIKVLDEYKQHFGWNENNIVTEIQIPQKTLNTIIETEIPTLNEIDIMTIDVEGWELSVLKGLDLKKYKPKVLCVENANATFTASITNYLAPFDYVHHQNVGHNDYYKLV